MSTIGRLLAPTSIALIGASPESLWTQAIITNLRGLGYGGSLHLVHPRHRELFGQTCHPSLAEVPGEVGCAYVMTGTRMAPSVIEECGRCGVRSVVMLTAGFSETGAAGASLEADLVERCRSLGITLQGPNCLGYVNYQDRVPAYALTLAPPLVPGGVALISQSGAMLLHFHRLALQRAIGLAYTVSIGNEAMLRASDFVDEFLGDPRVRVIGALLEGVRDGPAFLRVASRALSLGKPVVVLKVGRSEAAARSVLAHTGSMAGSDRVTDAVFRQFGVIRVSGLEELMETCALLAARGWPPGGRTAVVSTSGGACGLISDLAAGGPLSLPDFGAGVKERLASVLPQFGAPQNPLDTTGVIVNQPSLLGECIDAVSSAQEPYDALFVNSDVPREPGPNPANLEERLAGLAAALERFPGFSAASSTAAVDLTDFGRQLVVRHGLHFANGLTLGVRALEHAVSYGTARAGLTGLAAGAAPIDRVAPDLVAGWSGVVGEVQAKRLLEAYGVRLPDEWVAQSAAEAGRAASQIGFPVVMKVVSPDIPHKTDAGAVVLGVVSEAEAEAAYQTLMAAASGHAPSARLEGVLVARQVLDAVELIAGVHRDQVFGPVVLVGLGGIHAETVDDVALRLPPLDRAAAIAMLRSLRLSPLLEGARGRPAVDLEAVASVLVALGSLALDLGPRLISLDVNPLFALPAGRGCVAGDALLLLD